MKLNIQGKIMVGIAVILLLTIGVCAYLVLEMKNIDKKYSSLIAQRTYAYAWTEEALAYLNKSAANLRSYIIDGNPDDAVKYQKALRQGNEYLEKVLTLVKTEEGKRLHRELNEKVDLYEKYGEKVFALVKAREEAGRENRAAAEKQLLDYFGSQKGVVGAMTEAAEVFASRQAKLLNEESEANTATVAKTILVSIVLVTLSFILGLVIAFFIARAIASPIRLVDAEAAKIASGDLTGRALEVKSGDEAGRLAESFNAMLANLKEIVGQLQEKSQSVASSAGELSASAENVSAGTSETTATISQVASTVEQVTANAQRIADVSTEASSHARNGTNELDNVGRQMQAIQESTSSNREAIHGLNESAVKITQIVELITHIADQTNLLALNAAIEAARAGDHGRGFAVVAEEVRKLAEQSAGAGKEIKDLIIDIQQEAERAVQSMDQSVTQVETGAMVVKSMGETFEKIISAVQGLAGEIQSVAAAAEEMSSAVQNVAASAEEQTAAMEEVASTTQGLAGLAVELEGLANRFKLA